jgi:hypothetical protein
VTPDGAFDVLFNICLAPDDPTNRFGVPSGFEQVAMPDIRMQMSPEFHIARQNTKKKHLKVGAYSETSIEASTNSNEMALLHLPDGASSRDLHSHGQHIFRDYALKHGQSWYEFVNGDLRRMVGNTDLYLVTGVTKSTSWCIAAADNFSGGKVSLRNNAAGDGRAATSSSEWENVSSWVKSGPHRHPGEESWQDNQTVFIRGFKVALRSPNGLSRPSIPDNSEDEEWFDEYVPNVSSERFVARQD